MWFAGTQNNFDESAIKLVKRYLFDHLYFLFLRYGYHLSSNSYFICHEQEKIKKMFEEIRNYDNSGKVTYYSYAYKMNCQMGNT